MPNLNALTDDEWDAADALIAGAFTGHIRQAAAAWTRLLAADGERVPAELRCIIDDTIDAALR